MRVAPMRHLDLAQARGAAARVAGALAMDQGRGAGGSYSGPVAPWSLIVTRIRRRSAARQNAAAPSPAAPHAEPSAAVVGDERLQRVYERPDGWHWIDVGGRQEFGPFETLEAALADMDAPADEAIMEDRIEAAEQGLELPGPIDPQGLDEPETET